mgnify:CR=1 FL=1
MNTRKLLALAVLLILGLAFYFGMDAYRDRTQAEQDTRVAVEGSRLVRMHTPIIGPQNAPVTIVEFFDPSCEACRSFYPYVKNILAEDTQNVRLVLRYVLFHKGSEEVVRCEPILETMAGWSGTTFGAQTWDALPPEARAYLHRIEEICEVSIDVISTGPERDETILKRHPFGI